MTLEEARDCLKRDICAGCKYHLTDESCQEKALEIAVSAIDYLMVGQKLSEECEKK